MLLDITQPLPGYVWDWDGNKDSSELAFSSETVTKQANWSGYHDPESGIAAYKVQTCLLYTCDSSFTKMPIVDSPRNKQYNVCLMH